MFKSISPKILPLSRYEFPVSEDSGVPDQGVIEHVIEVIGPASRFCVEFGTGDGRRHLAVRNLIEAHDFGALLIEGDTQLAADVRQCYAGNPRVRTLEAFVTSSNIEAIFEESGVPSDPDVMLIDIDGNDYHIWKAIRRYRPRLVIIEINASYAPHESFVAEYDERAGRTRDDYWGASIRPMAELARDKGYSLIHTESGGDNLFFVLDELFSLFGIEDNSVETMYQLPQAGKLGRARNGKGAPASARNTTAVQRLAYRLRYYLLAIPRLLVKRRMKKTIEENRRRFLKRQAADQSASL